MVLPSLRGQLTLSDFRTLALSDPARHRLGNIAEAQVQHPDSNTKLPSPTSGLRSPPTSPNSRGLTHQRPLAASPPLSPTRNRALARDLFDPPHGMAWDLFDS